VDQSPSKLWARNYTERHRPRQPSVRTTPTGQDTPCRCRSNAQCGFLVHSICSAVSPSGRVLECRRALEQAVDARRAPQCLADILLHKEHDELCRQQFAEQTVDATPAQPDPMLLTGDNSCITAVDYPRTGMVACCSVLHDRSHSERDTRPSAPLPDGLRTAALRKACFTKRAAVHQAKATRARTPGVPHRGRRHPARPHKEIDYG
jgi:hypothetical protein